MYDESIILQWIQPVTLGSDTFAPATGSASFGSPTFRIAALDDIPRTHSISRDRPMLHLNIPPFTQAGVRCWRKKLFWWEERVNLICFSDQHVDPWIAVLKFQYSRQFYYYPGGRGSSRVLWGKNM